MDNIFSILREDSNLEDVYDAGPWAGTRRYHETDVAARLHSELIDLDAWLSPTESEERLRLLVITRFTRVIETYLPGCVCLPQGSSANGTYLPVSDIDLIIMNVDPSLPVGSLLRALTKVFLNARMISNFLVLDRAAVPIVKLTERPFGFSIDICVANINGALNVPRVRSIARTHALFRPLLLFLKLLVHANRIDDPASGGFGSNQLVNIVLALLQAHPGEGSAGALLLRLLEALGSEFNFFLAGVSTACGGQLFPKADADQVSEHTPEAFVFEDPQFRDRFIGCRTSHSLTLRRICRQARSIIAEYDYTRGSALTAVLPDISGLLQRRSEMRRFGELLEAAPSEFARMLETTSGMVPLKKRYQPFKMQEPKFVKEENRKSRAEEKRERKEEKKMKKQIRSDFKKQKNLDKYNYRKRENAFVVSRSRSPARARRK